MPANPFNPVIGSRGPTVVHLSDVPTLLALSGLAMPFGAGFPDRRPEPGMLSVGIPGVIGLGVANPVQILERLPMALGAIDDVPIELQLGEPTGLLPPPFFLARPGSFKLQIGETGNVPDESPPISSKHGETSMIAITMAFQQQNGEQQAAWTESYQTTDTSMSSARNMLARYANFIDARLVMLAEGVTCTGIRFVDLPVGIPPLQPQSRNVVVAEGPFPSFNPSTGQPYYNAFAKGKPVDFSGNRYLLRVRTPSTNGVIYSRPIWLGGLPDDYTTPLRTVMNPGYWTVQEAIFETYISFPGGNPSLVRVRTLDRSAGFPVKPCTGINTAGDTYTVPAHGFADGQVVNASRFKTSKGGCKPSGIYRIGFIDANTFTLRNAVASARITTLGSFRMASYLVLPLINIQSRSFRNKKPARPSNLLRGKSPKRLAVRA